MDIFCSKDDQWSWKTYRAVKHFVTMQDTYTFENFMQWNQTRRLKYNKIQWIEWHWKAFVPEFVLSSWIIPRTILSLRYSQNKWTMVMDIYFNKFCICQWNVGGKKSFDRWVVDSASKDIIHAVTQDRFWNNIRINLFEKRNSYVRQTTLKRQQLQTRWIYLIRKPFRTKRKCALNCVLYLHSNVR